MATIVNPKLNQSDPNNGKLINILIGRELNDAAFQFDKQYVQQEVCGNASIIVDYLLNGQSDSNGTNNDPKSNIPFVSGIIDSNRPYKTFDDQATANLMTILELGRCSQCHKGYPYHHINCKYTWIGNKRQCIIAPNRIP